MTKQSKSHSILESRGAANAAGLVYVSSEDQGFTRHMVGKGFSYRGLNGAVIRNIAVIGRIKALAIPPAWTSVWICPDPTGHIQAVGFDNEAANNIDTIPSTERRAMG